MIFETIYYDFWPYYELIHKKIEKVLKMEKKNWKKIFEEKKIEKTDLWIRPWFLSQKIMMNNKMS